MKNFLTFHKLNKYVFFVLAMILMVYAVRFEQYQLFVPSAALCLVICFYASLADKNDWRLKL